MGRERKRAGGNWLDRSVDRKTAWLRRYLVNERCVAWLEEEIGQWQGMLLPVSGAFARAQGGAGGGSTRGSRVERLCEKVAELEEGLCRELEEKLRLRGEIERAVAALEDERHGLVLRLRFIDGYSLEETSERMHYSYRQVCNLSRAALEALVVPGEKGAGGTGFAMESAAKSEL